ncbi:MAG TPA: MBL fold metallo-hydrolase [Ignavibacteriaceae bacterium]|nr:MBL fold metallo-hydrolase [Ignavibacteriaceae bacterium]
MIEFLPLGGAGEIGANCYYLNINEVGIILDCGMHPQKTGLDSLPKFDLLDDKPTDYILISHAHQDHLNALPFLIKKFPHLQIITTPQTRAVAELTLHNAISILKRQVDESEFEIYSRNEVDLLIKSINYKSCNEKFVLSSLNSAQEIEAEFFDAGHIIGSAGILLRVNGQKIFFTGDINLSSQTILPGASLPSEKIDILITETTYGTTDSSVLNTWEKEVERFSSAINKVINNGGSVLIPVFALGKLQEMLATIWLQMQKNKITNVDIYTGGIGNKINRIYDYNRYVVKRNDTELILYDIPQKNLNELKDSDELFKFPSIVLASSGMMVDSTNSFMLAKRWLHKKDSAIFTVGYMDPSTPGSIISKARRGDKIQLTERDKKVEVKCEIRNFRFSAHSKREELVSLVKMLDPDKVVLIHGDKEAINWMGASILKQHQGKKVYAAENFKEITFD